MLGKFAKALQLPALNVLMFVGFKTLRHVGDVWHQDQERLKSAIMLGNFGRHCKLNLHGPVRDDWTTCKPCMHNIEMARRSFRLLPQETPVILAERHRLFCPDKAVVLRHSLTAASGAGHSQQVKGYSRLQQNTVGHSSLQQHQG